MKRKKTEGNTTDEDIITDAYGQVRLSQCSYDELYYLAHDCPDLSVRDKALALAALNKHTGATFPTENFGF